MKSGGKDKALKDFDLLDPTDIKIHADGAKTGFVGERLVHLETSQIPSLYVSARKGAISHERKGTEIFYFKNMPEKENENWKFIMQ